MCQCGGECWVACQPVLVVPWKVGVRVSVAGGAIACKGAIWPEVPVALLDEAGPVVAGQTTSALCKAGIEEAES